MVSLARILFKQETFLKQEPVQANQLPSHKLQKIPVGTLLVLQSYTAPSNNHIKLSLKDVQFKGLSMNWYAYAEHVAIIKDPLSTAETVDAMLGKQQEKDGVKIIVNKQTAPAQTSLLKLVFNVDTAIKRQPVPLDNLNEDSKQKIPAGTEFILLTNKPDINNSIKLPIKDSHVKFTLKDIEFKGFNKDWYVFVKHVGIQRIG
jgi:hypothetical protein